MKRETDQAGDEIHRCKVDDEDFIRREAATAVLKTEDEKNRIGYDPKETRSS